MNSLTACFWAFVVPSRKFVILWLLVTLLPVAAAYAEYRAVVLEPGAARIDLAAAAYALEDPGRKFDLDMVRSQQQAGRFALRKQAIGFTAAAVWMRFSVTNPTDQSMTRWFDTGNRTLQEIDLYAPDAQGHYHQQSASSALPFAQRPVRTGTFVFPVELPPRQTVELFLRMRATGFAAVIVNPALWQPDDMIRKQEREKTSWLLYLGVCLTLGGLNLMLWLYLRDIHYLLYVGSLISFFWGMSSASGGVGSAYELLWPDTPLFEQISWVAPVGLASLTAPYFICRLLNLQRIAPALMRWMWSCAIVVGLVTAFQVAVTGLQLDWAGFQQIIYAVTTIIWIPIFPLLIFGIIKAVKAGDRLAWYVIAAYSPLLLNIVFNAWEAVVGGSLPQINTTTMWCSAFELAVMALALADRFYQEKTGKEKAQAELIATLLVSEKELEAKVEQRTAELASEQSKTKELLLNILPEHVIQELAATGSVHPARHAAATIMFTDFAGFTAAASTMADSRMVDELNEIFAVFDEITYDEGVEKIKTIGDAYMAVAGLSSHQPDHAQRCTRAALRMVEFLEERNRTAAFEWKVRVGIHSGPVVSGVVGKRKYAFDIWGDAVNIASRMESSGEPGRVNVSACTHALISPMFDCTYRGKISAKGKGDIDMFFVDVARRDAAE